MNMASRTKDSPDSPAGRASEWDAESVAALRIGIMRMSRRLQSERPTTDITLTQLSVLAVLVARGQMTLGELANIERVKPPSMTRTVNHLEEAGLVKRCAHECVDLARETGAPPRRDVREARVQQLVDGVQLFTHSASWSARSSASWPDAVRPSACCSASRSQ